MQRLANLWRRLLTSLQAWAAEDDGDDHDPHAISRFLDDGGPCTELHDA